ncbi:MAG: hypothetical protein KJO40_11220 [Deltaproteobacteria bacterium]|nr:hypothetical protein [Deltaproteobacteria bacterium]NND30603.1 hypothetical protein [Myxococcales bacterium]NNK08983.1 hypothetical protein [Myxococcales bacterium]
MKRVSNFTLLACLMLAAAGCAQSTSVGAGGSAGSGGAQGSPALDPLSATPRYAVLSSDFSSSSIAVLDADFATINESWLSSGTTYPGLVATLSGDVVLPNRQAGDGTLAVIDRFFTDVVTRFFVPSGNLNGQLRTQGEIGDSGFSSNPQDFIFVDSSSAWVPRYESNLSAQATPENQGNDLFEVNPSDMSATGDRIDLSPLDTTAAVGNENGAVEVDVFARPSRGVLVGSTIVVGLDRISANFDAAGPGMVAVVDLDDASVEGLELPGLESCGRTVPVPGEPSKVVVACVGFAQPFGDEPQVRASSGIALLGVGENGAVIEEVWRVADDPMSAIAVNAVIAIDAARVLGVASGDFATTSDRLYLIDLETGAQELVLESSGSFVIGEPAFDPLSEMLYVPDAAENAVLELAADGGGFVELGSSTIAPGVGLPPTKVYLLD